MWYRWLLLFVISFFTFNFDVDADVCDREYINQLKKAARQIEINYEYIDDRDNGKEEISFNSYYMSVNLISNEIYLDFNGRKFYYEDYKDGLVNFRANAGSVKLIFYSSMCADIKLNTIYLNLPKFNSYSYRKECEELDEYDLDVCDPWYQGTITDDLFLKVIDEYINANIDDSDDIVDEISSFFKNNYFYMLLGIVLVILIITIVVIKRKRSVLE